ncbi:hypothetical protein Cylst_1034 [Cylindrospermum stagnale PCC 7417]|uniref:Uncharacterized protein n=1 Tax=Cylindrospermum stagnale PCC 7417 TaxID=56107 RepID=K9WUZ7_9NOST|nr:hypothetical protein [Cylindrospermum stagnale]AFZ23352.1 hypothetical protein Cylst_1034 [Cylindrospermum stagnale PCC 7417]
MFAAKKATKSPKSASTDYKQVEIKICSLALVEELTDTTAEQVCGGASDNPETTETNKSTTPSTGGNSKSIPLGIGYGGLGTAPFYSPLPASKLPRLGELDPSKRTPPTKNAITITIPLPSMPTF